MEYLLGALFVVAYLAPYAVAAVRAHPHENAIFVLNLFLGWTFLGWVGALVWAFIQPARTASRS